MALEGLKINILSAGGSCHNKSNTVSLNCFIQGFSDWGLGLQVGPLVGRARGSVEMFTEKVYK